MVESKEDLRKLSDSEFLARAVNMPPRHIVVEHSRVEIKGGKYAVVDCSDGTFYDYKPLRELEQKLGLDVIVRKASILEDFEKDGRGTALLTDCSAERIVSWKLYSNSQDPKSEATVLARRYTRYAGLAPEMFNTKLEVYRILDWESGDYEVDEVTLPEYLTDSSLHTSESMHYVLEARPNLSIEDIRSLDRVFRKQVDAKVHPAIVDADQAKEGREQESGIVLPQLVYQAS